MQNHPNKLLLCLTVVLSPFCAANPVALAQDKIVPFTQVTIDANPPRRPWFKMVGDISGDGFADIVVGGSQGPLVVYVYPNWKKTPIADGGYNGVNGEIADLDGDGDRDIVMGGVVWFENPGGPKRFGGARWKRKRIDNLQAHDIEVADLDSDGRLDVIARDQSAFGKKGNKISIYYQQSKGNWNRRIIDCPHGEGLKVGDLDRDGDADIVIGAVWYENPGVAAGGPKGQAAARWIPRQYTSQWTEPDTKVELADFNRDGRIDIVLSPAELQGETYRVCWYEAPADPKTSPWRQHNVVKSIECVIHSLGVGDFNGDGDIDIAIAEMHQGKDPDEVIVMFNQNKGAAWRKQALSQRGSHDIVVADLDGDADLDILGANHDGVHPLELWRNDRLVK